MPRLYPQAGFDEVLRNYFFLMHYLIVIPLILLCLCANQMPPGGGPDDTAPPTIIRTVPTKAAVGRDDLSTVTLEFSEWIDPRSAKRSISVFPPVDGGFEVVVKGRKVIVTFGGLLADSTTYHVAVDAGLEDLHRVRLGTPYQLVFSTGPTLDSGVVFGCVLDFDSNQEQPKVALHALDDDWTIDSAFLAPPMYVAQTDSSGRFALEHVRRGTYAVLGFVDRDGNGRPGFGRETAYAPSNRRITVDSTVGPLELFSIIADTASVRISSLEASWSRLLLGQWGRPDRNGRVVHDTGMRIEPIDGTLGSLSIDTVLALDETGRFAVLLADSLTSDVYRLIYAAERRYKLQDRTDSLQDTVQFPGVTTQDTIEPMLLGTEPRGTVGLEPELKLIWSEPVRCLDDTWFMVDTTGDTIQVTVDTSPGDTVAMVPQTRLTPGTRYSTAMHAERFVDLAGNHPVDTSDTPRVSITFSTIHPDSICLSLSGWAACSTGFVNGVWVFDPVERGEPSISTPDNAGSFVFDSIPGGRGTMALYDDRNGDGERTLGSLFPWIPPEPFYAFDDTVEARPRWDIEGVVVDNCGLCARPKKNTENPDASIDSGEGRSSSKSKH
ncbi:MAG: hypothetical protein GF344_14675 [Chitinivibrionales bacterium]|nr:hypothetical protein [Chitinivibrionales bacterium]